MPSTVPNLPLPWPVSGGAARWAVLGGSRGILGCPVGVLSLPRAPRAIILPGGPTQGLARADSVPAASLLVSCLLSPGVPASGPPIPGRDCPLTRSTRPQASSGVPSTRQISHPLVLAMGAVSPLLVRVLGWTERGAPCARRNRQVAVGLSAAIHAPTEPVPAPNQHRLRAQPLQHPPS